MEEFEKTLKKISAAELVKKLTAEKKRLQRGQKKKINMKEFEKTLKNKSAAQLEKKIIAEGKKFQKWQKNIQTKLRCTKKKQKS